MLAKCIKRLRGEFYVPSDMGFPYKFKTEYKKNGIYEWKFLYSNKEKYDLETEDKVCMYGALPHYLPKTTFLEHFAPDTRKEGE